MNLFYMTGYVEAGILTSAAFSMPSFSEGEQIYLLCPPPSFWALYREKCYNSSRSVMDLLNLINKIRQNQGLSTQQKKRKFKGAAENTAPFLYFKFISHSIDAFHIIRQARGNPNFFRKLLMWLLIAFRE